MIRAALHTDESEIWWVYLLEGIAAIVFGLLLPMGSLLLSFSVSSTRARRAAADRGCGPYFLGLPPPRVGLAPPANFLRLSPASGSRFPTLNVDLHDAGGSRQANIVQPQGRPGDQIIEVDGQSSTGSPNWTSLIKAITTALNR